jgi:DNA-directed RNA polymerase subunit RPC12/RpoP
MLIGIKVKLSVLCPSCNARTQLAGLRRAPICHRCLKQLSLSEMLIRKTPAIKYYFGGGRDIVQDAIALIEEGQPGSFSAEEEYKLEYWRQRPSCLSCGAPYSDEAILNAGSEIACSCGVSTPVRRGDPGLLELDERIACVIGDAGETQVVQRPAQSMVLSCMSCGAGLKADGKSRTVTCTYCGSANYLPDDAWQHMHPVPPEHPFFLVIDANPFVDVMARLPFCYTPAGIEHDGDCSIDRLVESLESAIAPKIMLRGERLQRAKTDLIERLKTLLLPGNRKYLEMVMHSKAPYGKVAHWLLLTLPESEALVPALWSMGGDELLEQAFDENAPAAFLVVVARSGDVSTRLRLAQRTTLPAEAAGALAADADAGVRAALAARQDLPEHLVTQLASDKEVSVRGAVARNRATPAELLKQLRKDPAAEVQALARQNASYQPGFFSRLLGG